VAETVESPGPDQPLSFAADIRPLFRERDRESMNWAFDLGSYDDVRAHAEAILGRLAAGTMACDGAWPAERVEVFRRWRRRRCSRDPGQPTDNFRLWRDARRACPAGGEVVIWP
jgi:hypothetical protein